MYRDRVSFNRFLQSSHREASLLRRELEAGNPLALACARNPTRPQLFGDLMLALLWQGDPVLHRWWEQLQRLHLGHAPLSWEALDWPATFVDLEPGGGTPIAVPAETPLPGWRFWAVDDAGRLLAPYMSTHAALRDALWNEGTNTYRSDRAGLGRLWRPPPGIVHPDPGCHCGIRGMQSLTALRGMFDGCTGHTARDRLAVALVDLWGRVVGPAWADDWPYTIRAQYGRIAGTLYLHRDVADRADQVADRYCVEVVVTDDGWPVLPPPGTPGRRSA